MRLELPYLPPASFSPNSRVHWSVRSRDSKQVQKDVLYLLREQFRIIPSYKAIALKYCIVVPDSRRRDYENFVSRCKPITDAIVRCGIVKDDAPEYIKEYSLTFEVVKGKKATVIEVREIVER